MNTKKSTVRDLDGNFVGIITEKYHVVQDMVFADEDMSDLKPETSGNLVSGEREIEIMLYDLLVSEDIISKNILSVDSFYDSERKGHGLMLKDFNDNEYKVTIEKL